MMVKKQKTRRAQIACTIDSFSAKAPKKAGASLGVKCKLRMGDPDLDVLAQMCIEPAKAAEAMKRAGAIAAKITMPAMLDPMLVEYFVASDIKAADKARARDLCMPRIRVGDAYINKLVFDATDTAAKKCDLEVVMPGAKKLGQFMLDELGKEMVVVIQPMQGVLDF